MSFFFLFSKSSLAKANVIIFDDKRSTIKFFSQDVDQGLDERIVSLKMKKAKNRWYSRWASSDQRARDFG